MVAFLSFNHFLRFRVVTRNVTGLFNNFLILCCRTYGIQNYTAKCEAPRAPSGRGRHGAGLPGNNLLFDIVPLDPALKRL